MENLKQKFGFTLIELLIVISILGILASVGLANFMTSQLKSRDAQRKSDLGQIQKALELYLNDKGEYPTADGSGRIRGCPSTNQTSCAWGSGRFTDNNTVYIQVMVADPKSGFSYRYRVSGDLSKYQLFARLENENDPDIVSGLTLTCGSQTCNYGVSSPNTDITESI